MCATSTATRYCRRPKIGDFRDHERRSLSNDLTSHQTTYICSFPPTRSGSKDEVFRHHENLRFSNDTHRARLCERSRASRRGRCGNSTNRSWRSICGVADFGRNRTTLGRQAMFRPTRLSNISSERNTFNGAYSLHPRGQAPRHSACSACRRTRACRRRRRPVPARPCRRCTRRSIPPAGRR